MIQDSAPLQSLSRTQLIEQVEQLKQELHNLQEDRSPGPPRNPPTAHPPKKIAIFKLIRTLTVL